MIRDAIAAGTSQYGMQTFDQSLFDLYSRNLDHSRRSSDARLEPGRFPPPRSGHPLLRRLRSRGHGTRHERIRTPRHHPLNASCRPSLFRVDDNPKIYPARLDHCAKRIRNIASHGIDGGKMAALSSLGEKASLDGIRRGVHRYSGFSRRYSVRNVPTQKRQMDKHRIFSYSRSFLLIDRNHRSSRARSLGLPPAGRPACIGRGYYHVRALLERISLGSSARRSHTPTILNP